MIWVIACSCVRAPTYRRYQGQDPIICTEQTTYKDRLTSATTTPRVVTSTVKCKDGITIVSVACNKWGVSRCIIRITNRIYTNGRKTSTIQALWLKWTWRRADGRLETTSRIDRVMPASCRPNFIALMSMMRGTCSTTMQAWKTIDQRLCQAWQVS